MRRYLILSSLIFSSIFCVKAQNYYETVPEEVAPEDKVYYGGNFGASFFGDVFYVELSPMVGYRVSPKFSIGGGVTYAYYSREYRPINQPSYSINSHNYGFRSFSRYRITPEVYAVAEYESMNVEFVGDGTKSIRDWVSGFMVGAGVYKPMGAKSAINVAVMYNFLYDDVRSPYPNAYVVRFGFTL